MSSVIYQGNPCRFCEPPRRHPGCYADCEVYKQWKRDVSERKKKVLEARTREGVQNSMERRRAIRRARGRNEK